MKNLRLITLLFLSFFVVTLASCDDDDEDKDPSRTDLLTAGLWTGNSVYYQGQDVSQFLRDSAQFEIKDLTTRFDKNGEYRETLGRTIVGTWEFANNEQDIIFDKGTNNELTVNVTRLTATEFYYEQDFQGTILEFRFLR
ncbi:hypothetical protein [Pontibacter ruber]|uniref:Lipocalin-like domain-containing protein n=1 Tax=Pontibacter ruber TaxID=1343895 RepID=A0ABW5CVN5_9BACT|nr:hypothetical protein [Pontibacter ruber]